MTDLVSYGALLVILFLCAVSGVLWCTWYVRRRERAITARAADQMHAIGDAVAARLREDLDGMERRWLGAVERMTSELHTLRQELYVRRAPVEHPGTVSELERIHDRLRRVDEKVDRMADHYQRAVLEAALRFTRPGSA